jgi:acetyl esterase/lipase
MQKNSCRKFLACRFISVMFIILIFTATAATAGEPLKSHLWPEGPPDRAIIHLEEEIITNRPTEQNEFGRNRSIDRVSVPDLTVYPAAEGTTSGAAVVIFPGGGFTHLAIDKEGHDVARWLNSLGITGIVVKYRTLTDEPSSRVEQMKAIVSDCKRAVRLVRFNAEKWGIDPSRIGVMGFSAGGYLAATVAAGYGLGSGGVDDPVSRGSCRPDFAGLIYPALPPDFESTVTKGAPPMFMVNACDDTTTPAENCLLMFQALRNVAVRAEMHLFDNGGHGFGLGVRGGAVAGWSELFAQWLTEIGIL